MWGVMEWARSHGLRWLDVGGVARETARAIGAGTVPEGDQTH